MFYIYCPNCNTEYEQESRLCTRCGTELTAEERGETKDTMGINLPLRKRAYFRSITKR